MATLTNLNANLIEQLICRTCLKMSRQHFNIFEYSHNERPLSDLIMECTSIEIFKKDGLPLNICNDCLEKLKSAYNFKEMVLQSHIELHQCIRKITEEKREILIKEEHIVVENNLLDISSEICTSNQPFASIYLNNSNSSEMGCKIMEDKREVLMKEEHHIEESNSPEVSPEVCASYQPFASIECSNLNFSETGSEGVSLKQEDMKDAMSYNYETSMAFKNEDKIDFESPDDTKYISLITTTNFSINYGATENSNESPMTETKKLGWELNEKDENHSPVYSNECNKTLTLHESVERCLGSRPGNLPLKCKQCDRRFADKDLLRQHINRHNLVARFPCDECGKMFKYRRHVELHKATHKTERPYKCDICNKTFKLLKALRRHQKTHTEREAKYVCEICDRAFTEMRCLNNHKMTHIPSDSRDFICKTCGKSFGLERNLKKHMKTHSSDKPYACTFCERSFRCKWVLKKHVLIHTNEKPYSCKVCEKTFRQKGTLSDHMRIHTQETPYLCKLCHTFLLSPRRLMTHMRKTHGKQSQEQVKQEKEDVSLD